MDFKQELSWLLGKKSVEIQEERCQEKLLLQSLHLGRETELLGRRGRGNFSEISA